jgi:hypothetical protein
VNTGRERDDHDRAVDRLLRQTLTGGDLSAADRRDRCPDSETLAAWLDGGLSQPEILSVEAHASNCSRCQALLAAANEAASAPDPAAETRAWSGWRLRWFVPIAVGAAAVVLWVAIPNKTNRERPDLPQQANAELSKAAPAPPQPDDKSLFNAPSASQAPPRAANEVSAKKESKIAPAEIDERRPDQSKDSAASEGQAAAAVDTLRAQEPAAPRSSVSSDAAAHAQPALAEKTALQRQAFRAIPLEISSPDPSVRWRVGAGGSVERTTDGGITWESTPTGIAANVAAGASPSPQVCWLVGRAGSVLLSTDGRTWRRVAFPEATDLTNVQALSAQMATVTAADGRVFRTSDGGLTWMP